MRTHRYIEYCMTVTLGGVFDDFDEIGPEVTDDELKERIIERESEDLARMVLRDMDTLRVNTEVTIASDELIEGDEDA